MNEQEIKDIVRPHQQDIEKSIKGGWTDYEKMLDILRPPIHPTLRACIVWDGTVKRYADSSENKKSIRSIKESGTTLFLLHDKLIIRFKKGDKYGNSRNIPTQRALAYHDNSQSHFNFYSVRDRVDIVYILDPTETHIEDICVVSKDNFNFSIMSSDQGNIVEYVEYVEKPSSPIVKVKGELISNTNKKEHGNEKKDK